MTEKDIISALEYCKAQGITSECEKCKVKEGCREKLIADALNLIKHKNEVLKSLDAENKQLKSDKIILENNYDYVKYELESNKAKATEIINKYIDKYKELCKRG